MQRLSQEEIRFVAASFCSGDSRLLEWQGDLYRAIVPERSSFYKDLFRDGVIDRLVGQGYLVECEPVQVSLEGYGLVIRHRRIPFISYPFEWSDEALKDAALFFLSLNLELLQHGLMLHDVHPWNILFTGSKLKFVDLGSIKPAQDIDLTKWEEEFRRFYVRPLRLLSAGQARIARLLLQDWKDWKGGVFQEDCARLTEEDLGRRFFSQEMARIRKAIPEPLRVPLRLIRRLLRRLAAPQRTASPTQGQDVSREGIVRSLAREVERIELPQILHWDYYRDLFTFPSFDDSPSWSAKHKNVARILRTLRPGSVIDIGSNRGWYAQLAAREGASVIATDKDELLVSTLYRDAKHDDLPLQALVLDLLWPSPGFGLLDFWSPAVSRLKCEMAMALALVHHLVHIQGMQFDHIVEGLSRFTARWLLTEFVPYEDIHLATWTTRRKSWYSRENFLAALNKRYDVVELAGSDPPTRTLILGKKRSTE